MVTAQQSQRGGLVLVRVELWDLLLVARMRDNEVCVRAVHQPGAGPNELVKVIGKQLEVNEDVAAMRRRQPLGASEPSP